MKITKELIVVALLALLLLPAVVLGQEQVVPERGFIEFGIRGITGTVHGRTGPDDIPFSNGFRPDVLNSGVNTYQDYRNGFYIPHSSLYMPNTLGAKSYFSLKTASNGIAFDGSTLSRDQSVLATLGRYGVYKLQFRWDQTPHIFSGTTRSLYRETAPGVWTFNPAARAALDTARVTNTAAALADAVKAQTGSAPLEVQSNIRKTGSGLASFDINRNWNVALSFSRENQVGTRPHGMCFGNSPSCLAAEVPESIDYFTNTFKFLTDFGQKSWGMQVGYWRQNFENNIPNIVVDNPFSTATNSASVTTTGNMGLYPNNKAQNLLLGGVLNLGKNIHFLSSISPGWVSQNDPFVAYTTNTFLLNRTGAQAPIPLPASSLNGQRQTLAMNYTFVVNPFKSVELAARYRHYDHNNNTHEHVFNPYVNDIGAEVQLAGPSGQIIKEFAGINKAEDEECRGVCNEIFSFHTKDFDLSGTWFFSKKNSVKVQYVRQWFDRKHRDVEQTIEDILKFAVDLKPAKDLNLRITAAHQSRDPQDAEYEWFLVPGTQRPDEGFRKRNRIDLLAQYDVTSKLSVSGFFGTTQDNFNRRDALTSLTPLGDTSLITLGAAGVRPTPMYGPYYVYGVLKDIGWNLGADFNYILSNNVVLFGEYARERNANRMVSRQRSQNTSNQVGCPAPATANANQKADCDPINDWMTFSKDIIDTYLAGTDISLHKKVTISLYYGLSASKGNVLTDGVNCQIGQGPNPSCFNNFPNWKLDYSTSSGVTYPAVTFNFPETVTRLHEFGAIAKFKLANNLFPKFQYRYLRFDDKDFQTSVMNPYAFVGTSADPAGNTGLQRWVFLGADTPGYKAHIISATLEYHF